MGNIFHGKSLNRDKIIKDTVEGNDQFLGKHGSNKDTDNIGLDSGTPGAINPTTDNDDEGVTGRPSTYGTSNGGGASGDGRTPGYSAAGEGVNTLKGAQGNQSERHPHY